MHASRIFVAIVGLLLTAGCEGVTTWCQQLAWGETVFTGRAGWFQAEPIYSRVVSVADGVGAPSVMQVGLQSVQLATATTESLREARFPELTAEAAPFHTFGVHNSLSDTGATIDFSNSPSPALVALNCWPGATCDFAVGWPGRPLVKLPATESQLRAALPELGEATRECKAAF